MTVMKEVVDKVTKAVSQEEVTLTSDECNRPETTLDGLMKLKPGARRGPIHHCGQCSQLSDGPSAWRDDVGREAAPAGTDAALASSAATRPPGCEAMRWASGPIYAVPRLLERKGLRIEDIDCWS